MTRNKFLFICAISIFSLSSYSSSAQEPEHLIIGEKAPFIEGIDQFGADFNLAKQLQNGPVVLIFYRGHWCKYCNMHLEQLSDSIGFIVEEGASVVTVTPEKMEFIDETSEKFKGSFRIISDKEMKIMQAYKVQFEVDNFTIAKYKLGGINLNKFNGDNGNNLPVPATYIIGMDGLVRYSFFNEDYKKRVSISTILKNL